MTTTSPFGESVPVQTLADGHVIPTLALGVWQSPEGRETEDAVRWALELGYRHIDTAQGYGNEAGVGEGFRQSGLDRSDVFITTKFYPGSKDPVRELEASLERLKLEYVDLYVVHWPQGGPTWAWPGMEQAHSLGYARSIGVSEFSTSPSSSRLVPSRDHRSCRQSDQSQPVQLSQGVDRRGTPTQSGDGGLQSAGNRSSSLEPKSSGDCYSHWQNHIAGPDPMGSPARFRGAAEVDAS